MDFEIKVMRARSVPYTDWVSRIRVDRSKTLVTIKIKGNVLSSRGRLIPLQMYGPRHIRNYLRRKNNGIVGDSGLKESRVASHCFTKVFVTKS